MGGILLLEDGRRFVGEAFGAVTTRVGEAVFHTAMTGYQEVLTDPASAGQVLTLTAAHVGNCGVNPQDAESGRVWAAGVVARSFSRAPSSWRAADGLHPYLLQAGVPGLHGVDTRALVRHLRTHGAMRCAISTDGTSLAQLEARLREGADPCGRALAAEVGCSSPFVYAEPVRPTARIAVVDGGVRRSVLRGLEQAGAYVRVHPITDPADAWGQDVDLVLFAGGPGDPAALGGVVDQIRALLGHKPAAGVGLGHLLLARALGASTVKLASGHRGANHPVRDEATGQVAITSQNHGYAVDPASLRDTGAEVTHVNLNDQTVSGFVHRERRILAVQFHPEARPHDSRSTIQRLLRFASEGSA